MSFHIEDLPHLNAFFNVLSVFFIASAFIAIRKGEKTWHERLMKAAVLVSVLFLAGYLWFHFQFGVVRYGGEGPWRGVYFFILITHTILATLIAPTVIVQVWAAKRRLAFHRRWGPTIAWTWLYVSVTGVVLYLFLRPYLP